MSNGSTELMQRPLIGLTLDGLRAVAAECGLPRFAAGQMAKWIYDKRVTTIDAMTDLSKAARHKMAALGYMEHIVPMMLLSILKITG